MKRGIGIGVVALLLLLPFGIKAQDTEDAVKIRIKTNVVAWATTTPNVGFEIPSAEFNQLVNEFPRVPRIDMTAAQHAVDEDAQFGILERPLRKITPLAGVHYVRPHFHKTGHIPAYRFSFRLYPVIFVQQVDYFALRQRVLRVRIFVKHLIKSDYERLFGLQRHIPPLFHFIIKSPAFQRFRPTPSPPSSDNILRGVMHRFRYIVCLLCLSTPICLHYIIV